MAFTTLEMIARLSHGMKAKAKGWDVEVVSNEGDIIVSRNGLSEKHIGNPLPMNKSVLTMEWVIEPKVISFSDAVKLVEQGYPITCVRNNMFETHSNISHTVSFNDIVNGTWCQGYIKQKDLREYLEEVDK